MFSVVAEINRGVSLEVLRDIDVAIGSPPDVGEAHDDWPPTLEERATLYVGPWASRQVIDEAERLYADRKFDALSSQGLHLL